MKGDAVKDIEPKQNKIYWSGKNLNILVNKQPLGAPLGKLHEDALNILRENGWKRVSAKTTDIPVFVYPTRKAGDFPATGVGLPKIRPFPQKFTAVLDDKKLLWFAMVQSGNGSLMPFTFHSIEDFLSFQNNSVFSMEDFTSINRSKKNSDDYSRYASDERFLRNWTELFEQFLYDLGETKLWFLKHANGVRGNAVNVYYGSKTVCEAVEKQESNTRDNFILQQEVPPLLLDKRKFVIRSHVLLLLSPHNKHSLQAYLHRDSIVLPHAEQYSIFSNSKGVHISNFGRSHPKPYLLKKIETEIATAEQIQDQIKDVVRKTLLAVSEQLLPDKIEKGAVLYHLFGFDFMVNNDGKVLLIEANAYPAIASGSMALVETSIFTRLVRDLLNLVVLPITNGTVLECGKFEDLKL